MRNETCGFRNCAVSIWRCWRSTARELDRMRPMSFDTGGCMVRGGCARRATVGRPRADATSKGVERDVERGCSGAPPVARSREGRRSELRSDRGVAA